MKEFSFRHNTAQVGTLGFIEMTIERMADKKKDLIEPIDGSFDEVVNSLVPRVKGKELGMKSNEIKSLPRNTGGKELDPRHCILDGERSRI